MERLNAASEGGRDPTAEIARIELERMLDAIKRDLDSYHGGVGEARLRKELADGTLVTVKIVSAGNRKRDPKP